MEKLGKIMLVFLGMLIFLTGFLSSYALDYVYLDIEKPFLVGLITEKQEPGNWISEDKIEVLQDRVIIYIENARLSRYADTGSMLPVLGKNSNGLRIVPNSPEDVKIGDIVSYDKQGELIVHRVVDKGEDGRGVYFVIKGDNNPDSDGKVYFEDIRYVTIALIY